MVTNACVIHLRIACEGKMEQGKKKKDNKFAVVFPICLGLGTGLGALMRNVGVGLAIGAGVGTLLGLLADFYLNRGG
jgi:hypothetical protein